MRSQPAAQLAWLCACELSVYLDATADAAAFPCSSPLTVSAKGIAFSADLKSRFASKVAPTHHNDVAGLRGGAPVTTATLAQDERFVTWMRTPALSDFRKLWGIIDVPIEAGETIRVDVLNQWNSYTFGGKKRIVLSTSTWSLAPSACCVRRSLRSSSRSRDAAWQTPSTTAGTKSTPSASSGPGAYCRRLAGPDANEGASRVLLISRDNALACVSPSLIHSPALAWRLQVVVHLLQDAFSDERLRLIAPHVVHRPRPQRDLAVSGVDGACVHQAAHLHLLALGRAGVQRQVEANPAAAHVRAQQPA